MRPSTDQTETKIAKMTRIETETKIGTKTGIICFSINKPVFSRDCHLQEKKTE